jgi:formylglycine-generating enzyme required for sulfatase activity
MIGSAVLTPSAVAPHPGMRWIPGGIFRMGSDAHYPEEGPSRPVTVDGFWMDATPVTNADFAAFVDATGHVTTAEVVPDPADYPGILPEMLHAGSLTFMQPASPVDMRDIGNWWRFLKGADWRHPLGPDSSLQGLGGHPVVHVTYADVAAYARWAGKALPTEAEWEFAARGGIEAEFAWGPDFKPGGRFMANTWQGAFPYENTGEDGHGRTSPVAAFPPNPFGLFDMIGNVWEWVEDWYAAPQRHAGKPCCVPRNPRGGQEQDSHDSATPDVRTPRKVLKGGSHLCAPNHCRRYRPSAQLPQPVDTSTCHVGFRCVVRPHATSSQHH